MIEKAVRHGVRRRDLFCRLVVAPDAPVYGSGAVWEMSDAPGDISGALCDRSGAVADRCDAPSDITDHHSDVFGAPADISDARANISGAHFYRSGVVPEMYDHIRVPADRVAGLVVRLILRSGRVPEHDGHVPDRVG